MDGEVIIKPQYDIVIATWVIMDYRVVGAIGKHVIAQFALAGGNESVGIEEAAELRIVISALQIIEPQLFGSKYAIVTFLVIFSQRKNVTKNLVTAA